MTLEDYDRMNRDFERVRMLAGTSVKIKFNAELFDQKIDSILASIRRGEIACSHYERGI